MGEEMFRLMMGKSFGVQSVRRIYNHLVMSQVMKMHRHLQAKVLCEPMNKCSNEGS